MDAHTKQKIIAQLDSSPNLLQGCVAETWRLPSVLLAPYKVKILLSKGEFAIGGRNSITSAANIYNFGDSRKGQPAVILGNHVESARGVTLMTGGEHLNERAVNISFQQFIDVQELWRQRGVDYQACRSKGPITIGDAAVIGANALICSGVTVGAGAVIGAGAVAIKDVPPFAIVAGNPARLIRYRFDEQAIADLLAIRWWDFRLAAITKNITEIADLHLPEVRKKYLDLCQDKAMYEPVTDNRIVVRVRDVGDKTNIEVMGAEMAGSFIPPERLPAMFKFFVAQIGNGPKDKTYFIKDIFTLSGMV